MQNPFETIKQDLETIKSMLKERAEVNSQSLEEKKENDFLNEFIPKKDVVNKLASASTLWKYEKLGKLQAYGIGGKRFYKKSEIEKAFIKLKNKGGEK